MEHDANAWSGSELRESLKRYEAECEAAGLAPKSTFSYVDYARRFLRWREGDYRPRGAVGAARVPPVGRSAVGDLQRDLAEYERELVTSGRQPRAIQTYVVHASQFVRWLDGRFSPGRGARALPRAAVSPGVPRRDIHHGGAEPPPPGPEWTWEGAVQATVVSWLAGDGWAIERVADTQARERGPDVIARRGDRRLAVEVKGYPQPTYAAGDKAGQPKKWHPASQARTYFGTALHAAMVMRDSMPGIEIAVALPDAPGYRALATQVRPSLSALAITVLLVSQDGAVHPLE